MIGALISHLMPKFVDIRIVKKSDFPEPGQTSVGVFPWDIDNDTFKPNPIFKVRSMCIKPVEGEPGQATLSMIQAADMNWMPSWIKSLMFNSWAPKVMAGIVS